jgi:opacity protein-like surface antigen
MLTYLKHMALAAAAALCAAPAAQAADQPQEWELINPTGEIEKVAVEPAKRITALEGKTIAKDFPDQRGARDFMRETAAMPYKFYSQETCVPGKDFGPYDENTFIPRFKKTESIKFFVSGGPGKQSQIWVPFPQVFKPVSKKIAE